MKRALIQGIRVAQLVDPGQEFPVAPSLHWVDAPDTVTEQFTYQGGLFVPPVPPPVTTPSALVVALDTLLGIPAPTTPQIVAVLRVWRQQLGP